MKKKKPRKKKQRVIIIGRRALVTNLRERFVEESRVGFGFFSNTDTRFDGPNKERRKDLYKLFSCRFYFRRFA